MSVIIKKGFTLVELLVVITIIGILSSIGLNTFTTAQIKARDVKRKAHLRQLADSFEAYHNDHGQYPTEAEIVWNEDFTDDKGTVYMVKLPTDPSSSLTYYYDSLDSGKKFQLYAYLENTQDPSIITMTANIPNCSSNGTKNCNYGVSSTNITTLEGRQL